MKFLTFKISLRFQTKFYRVVC